MKKLYAPSLKVIIQLEFIICLFFLPILNSVAQPVQLKFKYLTPNEGLSSSIVSSIFQDHRGFMWIGTRDGLDRFDGIDFKIYNYNSSDSFSLPDNIVYFIFEDRENNLLIGTDGGLSLFDWDNERFINYMLEESSPLYGIDAKVYNIAEDSTGNLWCSTNNGLLYFDRINNKAVQYTHNPNNPESLSYYFVNYVFIDSKNRIWVSTPSGLDLFQPETSNFKHIAQGENSLDNYSNTVFFDITEDHEGNIWIGSINSLFCIKNIYTDQNFKLTRYPCTPSNKSNISEIRLHCLFVDQEDNLWVGSENSGLFLFDRRKQELWNYITDDYDPTGFNNVSIQCIYMDKSDNLWIGTWAGGVNIASYNSNAIIPYKNLKGAEESLSNNVVSSFLQDHNGQIWVGTDGGGLNRFNEKTNRFTRFNMDNSDISSNAILSFVEDASHNIWMGTWGGGLVKFDKNRNSFASFTTLNSKIPDNNINSVAKGNNNDLWLGSFKNGLIHYQIDKNEFTKYSEIDSIVVDRYIFIIKTDSKGQLYLGTTSGLVIFSPEKGRYLSFSPDPNNPNSISHGMVYDILIENDTSVWIATQYGLNRFNPKTQIFKSYFEKDGLPNNVIKSLAIDNSGILWLSTNQGVCRFDYLQKKYEKYSVDDGLQGNEFNGKSAILLKNGDLLFGGTQGFNRITPGTTFKNLNVPRIVITDFFIFNKPVIANTDGSPLVKNICDTKEIILSYDQSFLTFYFAAMDFTSPGENQYAYMLENFDDNWIFCGSKREATYTNLDPGSYILRVKGSNNDGVWNEEGVSLKITILPPWYLTWYFKTIFAIAVISLVIAIFYIRTSAIRKQKDLLTIKVEERTKDLQNINFLLKQNSEQLKETNSLLTKRQDIIEKQSEQLKLQTEELKLQAEELTVVAENLEETNNELTSINATKDKFFSIIAHDLRSPFSSFLGLTQIMAEELPTLTMTEIQKIAVSMSNSATNLYRLLENLLEWSQIQKGSVPFSQVSIKLRQTIDESIAMLMEAAKTKEIEVAFDIPEELEVYADLNMFLAIIRNLVSNALKFTPKGGKVRVSAEAASNKSVKIAVEDSGIGMSREMVENLFRIDVKTNRKGTGGEPSTGLGLLLCKEFIEKNGGKLWVESEQGKGSTFYFSIPTII